ncbi:MAG: cytochrome C [Deltaproteobacteria bacterium]|nr:cytochrome C [Deltaproteobacteria bacterium]
MKKIFFITAIILFFFAFSLSIFRADALSIVPTHADRTKVKKGCGGCHIPHKGKGPSLLEKEREMSCAKCHDAVIEKKVKTDDIGDGKNPKDVYTSIRKSSNHPVLTTTKYHKFGEVLPETDITTPRHAACFDCHNAHVLTTDDKFKGLEGVTVAGSKKIKRMKISNESEICYKCHGDSANLPANQKNKRLEFLPANASYHPVEDVGKRTTVPSLRKPLTISSTITCSDCHGDDDQQAAKGPHGSNFAPILRYNYATDDNQPESYYRYESCYRCHDRNSILADESFKVTNSSAQLRGHNYHIVTAKTSCYACHNSHGSARYKDLIDFDKTIVVPNQNGRLDYVHEGNVITCYLKCHNKQHGL